MDTFKNLSIGRKLSLSFGFLLIVVLILGVSWQRGIETLKSVEEKRNNLIELKDKLREMQVNHYRWTDALRDAVRHRSRFEGELNPEKCAFGEWYYAYKMPYPELKGLFESLEKPHKQLHEEGALVVKAIQQGNYAEAERLSLHTRQVLLPELMKVYEPFMQGIGGLYDAYKVQAEQSVRRQGIISKGLISLALISVIILAILLTRGIVRPLKNVTDTAHRIAEGEIPDIARSTVVTNSQNEIIQLEEAFITMAASLNELTKTAEKIASGNLDTAINIRSKKDVLANAIAKMVENLKTSVEELHNNSMKLALGMSDYFTVISELSLGNLDVKASEDTGDDLLNQLGKAGKELSNEYSWDKIACSTKKVYTDVLREP